MRDFDKNFPRYTAYSPKFPVWCLTGNFKNTIHRFFDTSPLSPSGRYLAVFQLPEKDDHPRPGDRGNIVLVDLSTGEGKIVWETAGWEYQLGANINWGSSDHELIFNDLDTQTWTPYAVVLDPLTGAWRKLEGTVYHASPDGKYIVSANLLTMRRTQGGYGVIVPDDRVPCYRGTTDEDGVWLTELATGKRRLLISIKEAAERAVSAKRLGEYAKSEVYAFHTKWSPDGSKIMFSLRFFPDEQGKRFYAMYHYGAGLRYDVFAIRPDGSDLSLVIPAEEWDKGGHHTTWKTDSSGFTMNLDLHRQGMRLCQCNLDGTGLETIGPFTGSGHPSFHPDGRWGVTDCYRFEALAYPDGNTVPLRLFDLHNMTEEVFVRLPVKTPGDDYIDFRLDPHPVWADNFKLLFFNGMWNGYRAVFCADMSSLY
ncbi:MAG: PD40 domain-containing protein [Lentisphaeria bacterium]|nr:PD40 domain-containing protein [Lentisphaeria bacterium]